MTDRFELENNIMSCWNTADDIKLLADQISNKGISEDEIQNALLGILSLHEMRCQKLMDTFEDLIYNNSFINNYEEDEDEMCENCLNPWKCNGPHKKNKK